jgi:hypothetical protein
VVVVLVQQLVVVVLAAVLRCVQCADFFCWRQSTTQQLTCGRHSLQRTNSCCET